MLNNLIALYIGRILASMWFFWVCVILIVLAVTCPSLNFYCMFISSCVIQLLALPILAVLNNMSEKRILDLLCQIWSWQRESHDDIKKILEELNKKV